MHDDLIQRIGRDWELLWQPPARSQEVIAARQQLHWASRLLAAVGEAEVEPADDDAHTALTWETRTRRLAGARTRRGQRVTLDPAALRLAVEGDDEPTLDLAGRTLAAALGWLGGHLAAAEGGEPVLELCRDEMPENPLADDEPFTPPGPANAELARWYADAARLLDGVRALHRGAAPVRCRPRRFDISTRIPFAATAHGEERSIGVGMSPGDGWHPEPYFYVVPSPPPAERPQRLGSGGFWNTEGWVGAALVAHRMTDRPPAQQGAQAAAFIASALVAAKELIGVR